MRAMTDGTSDTINHNPEALSRVEVLYPFVPYSQESRKLILSVYHEVMVKPIPCGPSCNLTVEAFVCGKGKGSPKALRWCKVAIEIDKRSVPLGPPC